EALPAGEYIAHIVEGTRTRSRKGTPGYKLTFCVAEEAGILPLNYARKCFPSQNAPRSSFARLPRMASTAILVCVGHHGGPPWALQGATRVPLTPGGGLTGEVPSCPADP